MQISRHILARSMTWKVDDICPHTSTCSTVGKSGQYNHLVLLIFIRGFASWSEVFDLQRFPNSNGDLMAYPGNHAPLGHDMRHVAMKKREDNRIPAVRLMDLVIQNKKKNMSTLQFRLKSISALSDTMSITPAAQHARCLCKKGRHNDHLPQQPLSKQGSIIIMRTCFLCPAQGMQHTRQLETLVWSMMHLPP